MAKLTDKQQRFVREYLIDLNATQAAIRAGYSSRSARQAGAENMSRPAIAQAIQAVRERIHAQLERTAADIRRALDNQGFYDPREFYKMDHTLKLPHELTLEQAQLITKVITEVIGGKVVITGYEFANRQAALIAAGKDRGMFKERKEIEVKVLTKRVVLVMDCDE